MSDTERAYAAADAWRALAEAAQDAWADVGSAASALISNNGGATVDAFELKWRALSSSTSPVSLPGWSSAAPTWQSPASDTRLGSARR